MRQNLRQIFLSVALCLVAIAIYWPLLRGEFIYDDLDAVWSNPQLASVRTLDRAFAFTLKPSRAISNVLLGLGEYLTPRVVLAQRAISILTHALVTLFLFLNLMRLGRVYQKWLPGAVCFGITLLFAVSPIHSETIAIAQYRMEMLGALFTLVAMYLVQLRAEPFRNLNNEGTSWRTTHKILLFLSLGAASLSKEPYVLIAPVLCIMVGAAHKMGRKTALEIGLAQIFWVLLVASKVQQAERSYAFSFSELLGYGNLTPGQHLRLSVEAFFEGIHKIVTGHNLTIVRLYERTGLVGPDRWAWGLGIWALMTSGLVLLLKNDGYWRLASGIFLITGYVYLLIPNINIGSEHYWYLATAAFWALVLPALWGMLSKMVPSYQRWFVIGSLCFAAAQVSVLERRVHVMRSRFDFYLSELNVRRQDPNRWVDLAATLIDNPRENVWSLAGPILDEARMIDPNNPLLALNDFYLAMKFGERQVAASHFRRVLTIYQSRPEQIVLIRNSWRRKFGDEPGTHAMK